MGQTGQGSPLSSKYSPRNSFPPAEKSYVSGGDSDYSEKQPEISYCNNANNRVPFYSLATAVRINKMLRGKSADAANSEFIDMVL